MRYVYDVEEVKERLPVSVAAAHLGITFDQEGRALCPFHDDRNNPNLELMPPGDDGYEWWYCRACAAAGDVIHLIRRVREVTFGEAMLVASEWIDNPEVSVEPVRAEKRGGPFDVEHWERRVAAARERALAHASVGLLSYAYGMTTDETPRSVREALDLHLIGWGWGLDDAANIVISHRDEEFNLTGVKVRYRGGDWTGHGRISARLYGSWRSRRFACPITDCAILCEGESDTVSAAFAARGPINAFGLPSGAGSRREEYFALLDEYDCVYLALDNDEAGRRATKWWCEALEGDVRVVPVPRGSDLRDQLSTRSLAQLLASAKQAGELVWSDPHGRQGARDRDGASVL